MPVVLLACATLVHGFLPPFTLDDIASLPIKVGTFTNSTVQVQTRDGVSLNSYVFVPVDVPSGGVPLVLLRTPYDAVGLQAQAAGYASQGFAAIAQDFRGRFGSSGAISCSDLLRCLLACLLAVGRGAPMHTTAHKGGP